MGKWAEKVRSALGMSDGLIEDQVVGDDNGDADFGIDEFLDEAKRKKKKKRRGPEATKARREAKKEYKQDKSKISRERKKERKKASYKRRQAKLAKIEPKAGYVRTVEDADLSPGQIIEAAKARLGR